MKPCVFWPLWIHISLVIDFVHFPLVESLILDFLQQHFSGGEWVPSFPERTQNGRTGLDARLPRGLQFPRRESEEVARNGYRPLRIFIVSGGMLETARLVSPQNDITIYALIESYCPIRSGSPNTQLAL
jgi:hypothetical protein